MFQQPEGPLAWFGDPDLKARVIAKLKQHRAMDEIIHGHYQLDGKNWEEAARLTGDTVTQQPTPNAYKGCAVGCTLPWISPERYVTEDFDWHKELELQYGIPAFIAARIDDAFESTDGFAAAADFAVEVIEAIPVGANLWPAGFCGGGSWPCSVAMCRSCLGDVSPQGLIRMLAMAPVPDAD